jgi:hypothetical protein
MNRYFAWYLTGVSSDAVCDRHIARDEQGNDKVGL